MMVWCFAWTMSPTWLASRTPNALFQEHIYYRLMEPPHTNSLSLLHLHKQPDSPSYTYRNSLSMLDSRPMRSPKWLTPGAYIPADVLRPLLVIRSLPQT